LLSEVQVNIQEYPFVTIGGTKRPILFVQFGTPGGLQNVPALVDVGTTMCCLPGSYAEMLGLELSSGRPLRVVTSGGETTGYAHDCDIKVWSTQEYHKGNKVEICVVKREPVCFQPGLHEVLLGVNFLDQHTLIIDYENRVFSIVRPADWTLRRRIVEFVHAIKWFIKKL
jgi:hypothetical protein